MSSLSDVYNQYENKYPRHRVPKEFAPFSVQQGNEGEIQAEPLEKQLGEEELLRFHGLDPEKYMIVGEVRVSSWEQSKRADNGDRDIIRLYSHRFRWAPRIENVDLPALFAAGRRAAKNATPTGLHGDRVMVVVWADPQTGKVGSRGGTAELIERVAQIQTKLFAHAKKVKPSRIVFLDAGDGVEGFENVPGQRFTNDLSLMDQVDLEATFEFDTVAGLAKVAPVTVVKVGSNHSAWRQGKGLLGRPQDDWGIFIGKRLKAMFDLTGMDVSFVFPEPEDLSVAVDAGNGTILGLTHGHVVGRPEQMPRWWADQVHGAQAVGHADILVTGHFHHLRLQPTGRNPFTGRSKYWIQAPTLDNGSDWYRNLRGDDSDPGLLCFEVTENGFDLQSLTVLGV